MKSLTLLLTLVFSFNLYAAVFIYGSGEATNLEDRIGFSKNDQKVISSETADPSSGGYTAGEGSLLFRDNSNTGELWLKLFSGDTDWVRMLYAQDNGSELLGFTYKQFNTESYAEHGAIANFNTGNNATFDGGGTISGTLAKITASLIDTTDASNYQFTQAAGSLNDYFTFKQFNIDNGVGAGIRFRYQYDGADDDLEVEVKCMTSGTVYSLGLLEAASTTKTFSEYFFAPSGCGEARIGISVAALNSGKIIKFNRWIVSGDPTIFKNLVNITEWESYTPIFTGFGTPSNTDFRYRRVGDTLEVMGSVTFGTTTATEARISLPSGLTSSSSLPTLSMAGRGSILAASAAYFTTGILIEPSVTYFTMGAQSSTGGEISKRNGSYWNTGETFSMVAKIPIANWSATSEHVVTPAKSNLSDWVDYTPSNMQGFGTVSNRDFKWRRVGDTLELLVSFTSTSPTSVEAQIELPDSLVIDSTKITGIKSVGAYFNSATDGLSGGSVLATGSDTYINFSSRGIFYTTGVAALTPTTGDSVTPGGDSVSFIAKVPISGWDSNATFLAAIPVQKTVYLKDKKTSGTDAGTSTNNTVHTRDLNSIEYLGSSVTDSGSGAALGFVSLASNQFTLGNGTYELEARSPAQSPDEHQLFLYDVSNSAYVIDGQSSYARSTSTQHGFAELSGTLVITSPTIYEVKHWIQTGVGTNGLGRNSTGTNCPQSSEVYTTVKITKVVTNDN